MARKVPDRPFIPKGSVAPEVTAIASFLGVLSRTLTQALSEITTRVNAMLPADGTEGLAEYTVATLPSAASNRGLIYVTNETGGFTVAFSDGTNWRRVQDRAIVS